jgi:transcriptional regulator with XRE-family HTH domain
MDLLPALADRVWFAYHCLPRDKAGAPPSLRSLEAACGLANGTIQKTAKGQRKEHTKSTFRLMAQALRVTESWLEFGGDNGPIPTGMVPPRPGLKWTVYGEMTGWSEAVEEAKRDDRQIVPPEAFRAGAAWPVERPFSRVTPEIATFVSGLAWQLTPPDVQARYSTEEARAVAHARRRHGRTA